MNRNQDWPTRLGNYIQSVRDKNFQWGEFDCALFACSCIEAMTGVDPAAEFRSKYKSKGGAAGALRKFVAGTQVRPRKGASQALRPSPGGSGGLEKTAETIAGNLCMEEIAPGLAGRGDVVLVKTELGKCLGIVDLNGRQIIITDFDGLSRHPLTLAKRAWRV